MDTTLEKETPCEFCGGTGQIEIETTICDDSTGYNTIVEGTGKFKPCFNCNEPDHESDDE